jgi:hypothetical protein
MLEGNRRRLAIGLTITIALLGTVEVAAKSKEDRALLRFAAKMAKQGNWREARYRWEKAAVLQPDDAYIVNNLAVSMEALGEHERARELYENALALSGGDPRIVENSLRLNRFLDSLQREEEPGSESRDRSFSAVESRKSRKGPKSIQVTVKLPLPPRLDVSGMSSLLVVSFLTEETDLLSTNRETVRFLRSEFRKRGPLQVLDVTPPPAVPEMRLEDLIANRDFWQHLGREYGPDLIVSGKIRFSREDASGFQETDVIDSYTGQKVRRTRFVEQEMFIYDVTVLFMDAKTGGLLHRDQFRRRALFRGMSNDPLTAFFELSNLIAGDVLSTLIPRTRVDTRVIFQS